VSRAGDLNSRVAVPGGTNFSGWRQQSEGGEPAVGSPDITQRHAHDPPGSEKTASPVVAPDLPDVGCYESRRTSLGASDRRRSAGMNPATIALTRTLAAAIM
jgi:hypothetical protein